MLIQPIHNKVDTKEAHTKRQNEDFDLAFEKKTLKDPKLYSEDGSGFFCHSQQQKCVTVDTCRV